MTERVRLAALQALFAWLHLALTAPSVYLWLGLPLLMRQQGWSGVQIGLFQLAGLPAVAKFLLARPVERGQRRYRAWGVGLCLALAAVLVLLGWADLLASPAQLFALAFAAALLATWADIPVNALAIRRLPAGEQLRAGALRSAALSLGAIAGGGLMLLVQLRWGWRAPFWALAGMLVLGAALLCLLQPEPDGGRAARVPTSLWQDWRGYIAQPGARGWTLLLVLYFPFVGTAWFYLKPLLLDLGFDAQRVAQIAGVGGRYGRSGCQRGGGVPGAPHRAAPRRACGRLAGFCGAGWAGAGGGRRCCRRHGLHRRPGLRSDHALRAPAGCRCRLWPAVELVRAQPCAGARCGRRAA